MKLINHSESLKVKANQVQHLKFLLFMNYYLLLLIIYNYI